MKLRLTDFDANAYEDTDGSCDMCMYTGMLDHPLYTFTSSYGESYTIEGWWSDWGHLTTIDVNLPVFTTWLHDAEFKEPTEIIEENDEYTWLSDERFWEEFLTDVLKDAEGCSTMEELNESLDWALKGVTMLTDEQFDELADKPLKKIAPKLGVELEEERRTNLSFRDKNGVACYLDECEAPCVIQTNSSFFLRVSDGIEGSESHEEYWVSSWGDKFNDADLAYILRTNDKNAEIIRG